MVGKVLSLFVTYLVGRASHPHKSEGGLLSSLTLSAIKKGSLIFALYSACVLVFVFGAVIITADLIITTKQIGAVALTDLSWVGFGVIIFAGVGTAVVSYLDFDSETLIWNATKKQAQKSNSLGDAVTLLILDFVEERKARREHPQKRHAEAPFDEASRHHFGDASRMN